MIKHIDRVKLIAIMLLFTFLGQQTVFSFPCEYSTLRPPACAISDKQQLAEKDDAGKISFNDLWARKTSSAGNIKTKANGTSEWKLQGYRLVKDNSVILPLDELTSLDQLMFAVLNCYGMNRVPLEEYLSNYKNIRVKLPSNAKDVVLDKGQFRSIANALWQIFQNSLKYNKKSDALHEIDISLSLGSLKIEVEDRGIGIPEDELSDVLDLSQAYRASNAIKHISGNGKGFNIAHKTVKRLGGTIHVESKLCKGTKVTIYIPHILKSPGSPNAFLTGNSFRDQSNTVIKILSAA